MNNKMKMFGVILTVIAILGCVTPTDDTGVGVTSIVLSIDDPNVGQGHSVAVTALLTNGWDKNLKGDSDFTETGWFNNARIYWKPLRDDLAWSGTNPQTNVNVIANSEQIKYMNLDAADDAFPGSYSVYATYCFAYETSGYQRVILNPGSIDKTPQSGFDEGPFSISFGGTPKINTNVQDSTSLQFTFNKDLAGDVYGGDPDDVDNKNKLYKVTVTWEDSKLDVTSAPSDFEGGTCTGGTCSATMPTVVSDRYSAAFEFEVDDSDSITSETEATVGITALYGFCIDSNTVSVNVVG